ncbi:MAG TPA: LysR family transcriptional regulator [Polyangiaceae bacterium]
MPQTSPTGEPRLADVSTFLNVCRTGSITGAARELGVTPSQVSKAIARLEAALHTRLVTRGARGIGLSAAGRQLLPRLQQVVSIMQSMARTGGPPDGELTLAAPSSLLPPILPRVVNALPRMRVRGIELPPELLRSYSAEELFDVAVLPGGMTGLPSKWANLRIGELRKSLFASPHVARELGPSPTPEQLQRWPFVGPLARDGGEFVQSNDDCPLAPNERTMGAEVGTMDLALRVAATCDQLVYGPVIAAQRELNAGTLVELRVPGWDVSEELFLACDVERVLARVQTQIVSAVRAALFELPSSPGADAPANVANVAGEEEPRRFRSGIL